MSTEASNVTPAATSHDDDATVRLMRMLDSVRLEKSEAEPPHPSRKSPTCPHCGKQEDWKSAAWCPHCFYNPKLGRVMSSSEILGPREERPKVSSGWLLWSCVGAALLGVLNLAVLILLPDSHSRSVCGRIQFSVGLLLLVIGQVLAFQFARRGPKRLPVSSIFFEPLQLWQAAFAQRDLNRHIVYCGAWGTSAVAFSLFLLGLNFEGMFGDVKTVFARKFSQQADEYSNRLRLIHSEYLNVRLSDGTEVDAEVVTLGSSSEPSQDGADEATDGSGESLHPAEVASAVDSKIPLAPSGESRDHLSDLIIFGYLTNHEGVLKSLLLAEVGPRSSRFAGKISLDETDLPTRVALQQSLDRIRSPRSALKTPYHARWVRPLVVARIAHAGWSPAGQLREAFLVGIDNRNLLRQVEIQQAGRP